MLNTVRFGISEIQNERVVKKKNKELIPSNSAAHLRNPPSTKHYSECAWKNSAASQRNRFQARADWSNKRVTSLSQASHKPIASLPQDCQTCHKPVTSLSQACHKPATSLPQWWMTAPDRAALIAEKQTSFDATTEESQEQQKMKKWKMKNRNKNKNKNENKILGSVPTYIYNKIIDRILESDFSSKKLYIKLVVCCWTIYIQYIYV